MKEKTHSHKLISFASVLGLILLLLFSPCKVRNYIESALDLPLTEVANKSKTTISPSSCETITQTSSSNALVKENKVNTKTHKLNPALPKDRNICLMANTFTSPKENSESVLSIPYYILHKNFKVYL